MWFDIIRVFDSANRRGPFLRACCHRHPTNYLDVFLPAQFEQVNDCNVPCGEMMECGIHPCPLTCHPESHDRIPCRAHCEKILVCGHSCTKLCFEECGRCEYPLGRQYLSCGHEAEITCSRRAPKCHAVIKEAVLPCGHVQTIQCSERELPLVCQEGCGAVLDCGHRCLLHAKTATRPTVTRHVPVLVTVIWIVVIFVGLYAITTVVGAHHATSNVETFARTGPARMSAARYVILVSRQESPPASTSSLRPSALCPAISPCARSHVTRC